jgi:two-component system, NtrC family, nitrogen regulation sensor histidine kinase NtrY
MKKRLLYGSAVVLLVVSVLLVVWQGSFNLGKFGPANPGQTLIFWAISSLIFILMVTLGFILFREFVKLYVERQKKREGSRIKTKLVFGALTLSVVPVFFLVWFSMEVLSRNMTWWFTRPVKDQVDLFVDISGMLHKELRDATAAEAELLAAQPETRVLLETGARTPGYLERFAKAHGLESVAVYGVAGGAPVDAWGAYAAPDGERSMGAAAAVRDGDHALGSVTLTARVPLDIAATRGKIREYADGQKQIYDSRKQVSKNYIMLMALITLFVLFLATWMALFLAKQISIPITALLEAASQVRRGNLEHRVEVRAVDELGSLVRAFNSMTQELESNARELDRRRRFNEAILESIPTGVISIGPDGTIQSVNRALAKIFTPAQVARATRLEDLFSREDTAEIKYLMKRARRTGAAARQLELRTDERKAQLAVTVSALEEKLTSGFVVVLDDLSELLRAQKSAAWHEVARRVAHEIKNPLTPIALSAERIGRQIKRMQLEPAQSAILGECAAIIAISVESLKTLVDEFSQFARFPSAQPVRSDLNEVVGEALAVFRDRLEGISIQVSFAPGLPPVNLDREQFGRVVINLVDNAAEAMQDSLVRNLYVATQPGAADSVELVVADSGCGVSAEEKEKLFLPYFSTKNRGTGLGLAIVSHIVAEHNGQIRVEDNPPSGARFTVEIPALADTDLPDSGGRALSPAAQA